MVYTKKVFLDDMDIKLGYPYRNEGENMVMSNLNICLQKRLT